MKSLAFAISILLIVGCNSTTESTNPNKTTPSKAEPTSADKSSEAITNKILGIDVSHFQGAPNW